MQVNTIDELCDFVFNEGENFNDRAILTPLNENVDVVNNHKLMNLSSEEHVYLSRDIKSPESSLST